MSNNTILIGLDGATFSILNPLMEEGVMPFLKQFVSNGVSGKLPSVVPPLTPPAWTTIMTGRSPSNHGILDFFRFESQDNKYLRLNNSRDISCETIWSIASRHDLKVTSLNFPMMTPPRPISGFVVPGWITWRHMSHSCYPKELYGRLKKLDFFSVKELALDMNLERAVVNGCSNEESADWIKRHIQREKQWFNVLQYLMNEEPCDLTAIVFDGMDRIQHLFWRFIHPEYVPAKLSLLEEEIRSMCLEFFSQLDEMINEIINMVGPDTRVIMVSDHGFSATDEIFYINSWLNQNGYLKWSEEADIYDNTSDQNAQILRSQIRILDLPNTTAYAITASNNGVYIPVIGIRGDEGIKPEEYESHRQELADKLLQVKDSSGETIVKNVLNREDVYAGNHMDLAPDLTVVLRDNGFISVLKSDVIHKKRPEILGTHHPEGIFIASGNGIRKETSIDNLSILDVASTVLYSLGIPIPEDMEGNVMTDIFTPDFLKTHPTEVGVPTVKPEKFISESPDSNQTAKDQEKILERLKSLGYVE
jgi:predicted AlkP superfamily phosphohydrolase/phosphomutase